MHSLRLLIFLALLPSSLYAAVAPLSYDRAEIAALRLVPGGAIVTAGLAREHGRLVWLFDVSVPGSRNLREIHVDASTGAVVSNTLELPTDR